MSTKTRDIFTPDDHSLATWALDKNVYYLPTLRLSHLRIMWVRYLSILEKFPLHRKCAECNHDGIQVTNNVKKSKHFRYLVADALHGVSCRCVVFLVSSSLEIIECKWKSKFIFSRLFLIFYYFFLIWIIQAHFMKRNFLFVVEKISSHFHFLI